MGFHPKPRQGNDSPATPICRTMNMVLRYRVEGVTPSWEFEGETLKGLRF